MPNKKILIVEDDPEIQGILRRYLERESFDLFFASTGEEGLKLVTIHKPDLMLLDINLPGIDGFEVLKRLQTGRYTPVIILTARHDDADKVVGLELGADDYLTKAFNPRELLARIRAVLRRIEIASNIAKDPEKITIGDVYLDCGAQKVYISEQSCILTVTEYSLLKVLMQNSGRVLSREQILDHVWGNEFTGELRVVDIHISNLRKKISEISPSRYYIQSVRGVGYKFEG